MFAVDATAYCLNGAMANGNTVHVGAVASNNHPLGTRIRLARRVMGRRYFRVEDRIGWGTQLDIWMPSCGMAMAFGRRMVRYAVVPRTRKIAVWKPVGAHS
jgi:3D (Asp-Asp-Asp) domain-containing protein